MRRYLLVGVAILCFTCCTNKKKEIARLVEDWEGKEILFPERTVFTIQGTDTVEYATQTASYKVLTYIDTAGCTSCRLRLAGWNAFMKDVDSLSKGSVKFFFFFFSNRVQEISHLLQREKFTHPVCIDPEDNLNRLNDLPSHEMCRTFLLDKDNKVLLIGNPIHNPTVKELYLEQITGKKSENSPSKTQVKIEPKEVNLGNVSLSSGGKSVLFVLRNAGKHPLWIREVATTCGCTLAACEKKRVSPGERTKITVRFTPEEEGFFNKVVLVHCNANASPIRLNVKGKVVK